MTLLTFQSLLKKYKKSCTPERQQLFECIQSLHVFSAQELFEILQKSSSISRASVFRALPLFENLGILRKLVLDDASICYELNDLDRHHEHLQCENCGKLISFVTDFCKTLQNISQDYGFQLKSHNIIARGICKNCQ